MHIACNTQKKNGGFLGPVFGDGSFRYIPIPEIYPSNTSWTYNQLSQSDHPSLHGLTEWIPREPSLNYAHYDPEFLSFTWGDYAGRRTGPARQLQAEDYYFFIASLRYIPRESLPREQDIDPQWAYYLIGFFAIACSPIQLSYPVSDIDRQRFQNNAHVRRLSNTGLEPFLVFTGTQDRCLLLRRAVPLSNGQVPNALAREIFPWLNNQRNMQVLGPRWWDRGVVPWSGVRALLEVVYSFSTNC